MADWRQIQARIRRAKAGPDAQARLTQLFERFRDAMVAFELGALHESAGDHQQAARWYGTAAERFRRAEWKKKAEEALLRLGAPVTTAAGNGAGVAESVAQPEASVSQEALAEPLAAEEAPAGQPRKKRRRGRRGGRGRRGRKAEAGGQPEAPARPPEHPGPPAPVLAVPVAAPPRPSPLESLLQSRARAIEPALASRLAKLEAELRRLISAPVHGVEDSDQAPAGPGVFLLSDADQVTHYYIEACQTLRIGLGQLLRGGKSRGGAPVRSRLAEELGISETRATRYLKEHCVVRWLQLDEGAPQLAHFAIAVLQPTLRDN